MIASLDGEVSQYAPTKIRVGNSGGIPRELREQAKTWLLWKYANDGRKMPDDWTHKGGAKHKGANDPALHLSFDDAVAKGNTRNSAGGIGLYLDDGIRVYVEGREGWLWVLDLDGFANVVEGNVQWESEACYLWRCTGQTYVEVSPSGTGLKIFFVSDTLPSSKAVYLFGAGQFAADHPNVKKYQQREVEVFSRSFYVAVTGQYAKGTLRFLDNDRVTALMHWLARQGIKRASNALTFAPLGFEVPPHIQRLGVDDTTRNLMGSSDWPETDLNIKKVKHLLSWVNADCAYDTWRNVVWSVVSLGWNCGEELARSWSQTAPDRYDEAAFNRTWHSYQPGGIGIGTLIREAEAAGYEQPTLTTSLHSTNDIRQESASNIMANPPVPTVTQALAANGWEAPKEFKLVSRDDLHARPAMRWRIKGVLPERGLAGLYGPSTSGKSFLAFDMACAIAEGHQWFGHRVNTAPVVYVALEGEGGFKTRSQAWEIHKGRTQPTDFFMVLQPFNLIEEAEQLARVIPKKAVVIVDTLNRAAPTADENSSKDMGAILEAAKALQVLTDGLVILVHHTGKDTTKGLRGHSSLFAALDVAIEVARDGDYRAWKVAKSKDGADGAVHPFRLELKSLGQDEYGDGITSCVVVADTTGVDLKRLKLPQGGNQLLVYNALRDMQHAANPNPPSFVQQGRPAYEVEVVIPELSTRLTCEKRRRLRAVRDALTGLSNRGLIVIKDDWLWMT